MTTRHPQPTPIAGRRIRGLDADQRAQQRRDLLLDAALDSFASDGYAGTSIEALCQAAYVGNKAFYEHFSSKEACYLELLQRNTHTIVERVAAALADAGDDEAILTRQVLTAFAGGLLNDPRVAIVTFVQSGGISPTIERQRRANRRQAATIVLTAWTRFGESATEPRTMMMASAVIGGIFELICDALDRSEQALSPGEVDKLIDDMVDVVLSMRAGMHSRTS